MTNSKNNQLSEYISRINKVLDYIENNINGDLSLNKIAEIAAFSKYHFHRIFLSVVGESLNQYILRIRLEKAAKLLFQKKLSITEIAAKCGFLNSSTFSRAFKNKYNESPSSWQKRKLNPKDQKQNSKNCILHSNICKEYSNFSYYIDAFTRNQIWRINALNQNIKIEVQLLPETTVAYVRHIGPFIGERELFSRLCDKILKWAGPRKLVNFPKTKLIMLSHDVLDITDEQLLRISICITVPPSTQVDGDIGKLVIPKGNYAIGYFEIYPEQYFDAWQFMCGEWLPQSGYQLDDRLCFEAYTGNPEENPQKKRLLQICIPVKPL
jgi:AraC family transcriptional regulator